jgi:hypothetical protein
MVAKLKDYLGCQKFALLVEFLITPPNMHEHEHGQRVIGDRHELKQVQVCHLQAIEMNCQIGYYYEPRYDEINNSKRVIVRG